MAFSVIAKVTLRAFWEDHADSEDALKAWYKLMSKGEIGDFSELEEVFSGADFVQHNVIFNIKGNHYRLITRISST